MALSSSSTLADALAQYNDNLSWEGDTTKALNCLAAVRWLLVNRPARIGDEVKHLNFESLENEKRQLESYLAIHNTSINQCSFTEGRMLL